MPTPSRPPVRPAHVGPRPPRPTSHRAQRLVLVGAALLVMMGPALVGVVTSSSASAATPTVVVSGYDTTRTTGGWSLFGSCLATTNNYLTDAANFGPTGTDHVNLDLSAGGMPTATADSLKGVNVFFTGYVASSTYTADEKTALLNYVKGGGALIGTSDETDYDMSDIFGMTLADSPGGVETGTITDPTSPLADGPFGTVTSFTQYDAVAHWTDIGPGQTVGTNPEGPAIVVIPPGALAAGSGPVVMVSDVDVFSDCADEAGVTNGSITNETLIKNIFAYVANFEATPITTTTVPATTSTTAAPATTATPAAAVASTPAFTG
jgi:hypothetical protein